jgi:hypothetical protein
MERRQEVKYLRLEDPRAVSNLHTAIKMHKVINLRTAIKMREAT